ncbi:hypothetical protein FACS189434_08590 [Bacteroidia bacterium]|nr:hypothetical protein FACS189434_08590 [Bacteroidia bacterium]
MKKFLIATSVCLFFVININAQEKIGEKNIECYTINEIMPNVTCIGEDPKRDSNYVYFLSDVDKKAEFPDGDMELYKFIGKNLRYPPDMSESGFQSRVICQFIIEKDGSISNITILKSRGSDLEKEAIRVIEIMPKWTPAEKNGEIVRCYFILPVTICLQ